MFLIVTFEHVYAVDAGGHPTGGDITWDWKAVCKLSSIYQTSTVWFGLNSTLEINAASLHLLYW